MAATDHPLLLDLGPVIGPKGNQGIAGASVSVGYGDPAPSAGANGDTYIDATASTIWRKANGVWVYAGPLSPAVDGTISTSDMAEERTAAFFAEARCVSVRSGNAVQVDFYKPKTDEAGDPHYTYVYPATSGGTDTRSFGVVLPAAIRPVHTVQSWCRFVGSTAGVFGEGPCILASTGEMSVPYFSWLGQGGADGPKNRLVSPGSYDMQGFFVSFTYVVAGERPPAQGVTISIDPSTGERVTAGNAPAQAGSEAPSFDIDLGGGLWQ